jgi:hypothetical protein
MRILPLLTIGALSVAGPTLAQDWSYEARLYGWVPAMDVSVDTRFGDLESSGSGSDALSALDMAFMGTFEARRGKWGLLGDLIYTDLSNSQDTTFGRVFKDVEVDLKLTALSAYALYRVYETDAVAVDVGGGFRAFGMKIDTKLNAASPDVSDRDLEVDTSWVDPLVAARVIAPFGDKWFAAAYADAGGYVTQDSSTWQAVGTVGYRFNERWSAQFGYRYMNIEKDINDKDVSVDLYGPVLGVAVSF